MQNIRKARHKKYINNSSKKVSNFFSKVLLSIILILSCLIYTNYNNSNYQTFKSKVIDYNIRLTKLRNRYKKVFGNVLPIKDEKASIVSGEITNVTPVPYQDGEKINYGTKTNIKALQSGIVVFIGNKEEFGSTIIIQGVDDTDIWYSNIESVGVNLYDYVEKNKIIGEVEDTLYLKIIKDKNNLKYEEYTKSI